MTRPPKITQLRQLLHSIDIELMTCEDRQIDRAVCVWHRLSPEDWGRIRRKLREATELTEAIE